ncbi:MAG: prepilin-type N-terminal cleavage/methylation domain-containing protein [Sedimentisphaerales bacterium]|nr:prepilin-type N-terminal cleavage/methylation domain-containing protein [Sedimentisphaerales bacterium]
MEGLGKNRDKGLTLIEVMISLIVILIVVIGAVGYMYATAVNAHLADMKATASRLGLLLIEGWRTQSGETDPTKYNPKVDFDTNTLIQFEEFDEIASSGNPPGLSNDFKNYRIKINGTQYFVKMSYQDDANGKRELNVAVAWDRNSKDNSLDYNTLFLIRQTKFASYVVE